MANCHEVFRRWMGNGYDTEALDAVLATAAVERLDGDPVWTLLVSGSGNAKTETVCSIAGAEHSVAVSTIQSEGALLSATSRKERTDNSTGGLLRKVGDRGIILVKDVTSILSMSRDQRAAVLGALREVYDGSWSRNVGTDGGQTLEWHGRLVLIGAVTTAWDTAHSVIAAMGDRFVLVRMDSMSHRLETGRQAIANTGHEVEMRRELVDAAKSVLDGIGSKRRLAKLTDREANAILSAANLVTIARTAVDRDPRGDVVYPHAPEAPTRFAKQLTQIMRGAIALGKPRDSALRLAIRCARDSVPPLRLRIIDDIAANPGAATHEVRHRLGLPRNTVARELQALHMLGVMEADEEETSQGVRGHYTLARGIEQGSLSVPALAAKKGARRPLT